MTHFTKIFWKYINIQEIKQKHTSFICINKKHFKNIPYAKQLCDVWKALNSMTKVIQEVPVMTQIK